jgi:hypothetical protein
MHYAVCYCVADLGTQRGPYGLKSQIYVAWELPRQRTAQNKSMAVGQFYTLVTDPRSNLCRMLEAWFGYSMPADRLAELDLSEALLGKTALLGIKHSPGRDGQMRAAISSIAPASEGSPNKTTTLSNPIVFSLEDGFDQDAYNALPVWLQNIVAKSLEYQKAVAPLSELPTNERLKAHLGSGGNGRSTAEDLDDDIPFITADPAFEPYLKRRINEQ